MMFILFLSFIFPVSGFCEYIGCVDLQKTLKLNDPLNLCDAIKPTPRYWIEEEVSDLHFESCQDARDYFKDNKESGWAHGLIDVEWKWKTIDGNKKEFEIVGRPSPDSSFMVMKPVWPNMSAKHITDMQKMADALVEHERGHLYLN